MNALIEIVTDSNAGTLRIRQMFIIILEMTKYVMPNNIPNTNF